MSDVYVAAIFIKWSNRSYFGSLLSRKNLRLNFQQVFIKIELQKPLINLFMYSFNAATALTCYDMYPWEYVNNDLMLSTVCFLMGFMFLQQFLQPEKTFVSIRYSLGICINVLSDEWFDSFILLLGTANIFI